MVSILDTLQKKKTGKRDKMFLIPLISIVLSVAVFALFVWQRNADEQPVQVEEPWSRTTSEHVEDRMIENNDSFLLYLYADWCPYCKEAMFGDSEATSGNGTLKKWVNAEDPDMEVYFEREIDVEERSDDLHNFMDSIKESFITNNEQDRWEWIGKEFEYDSDGGNYQFVDEQDVTDKKRPGVPGFLFINEGYVTGYLAGGQSMSGYTKMYDQLVVDANDCFKLGVYETNKENGCP